MKNLLTMIALSGLSTPALAASTDDGVADSDPLPSGKIDKPQLSPNIPPYSLDSKDFIFPSGLRVIMQPDHSAPIIAVTSVFDRGSTSDPVGKEGIAHFVEHMWFKSRHVEDSDIRAWDILSENGCLLNASTSNDWTNYMTVCPDTALPTLMRFASLRMTDTVKGVLASEVPSEREVIRNELRMRMENGGGEALRYIYDRVYAPEHPYHRLTIGTHDSLDNISLEDIQKFTEDHYRPEHATIVVVGNFEMEEAQSLIFENFAPHLLHPDLKPEHLRWIARPGVNPEDVDGANPDRDMVYWTAVDPNDEEAAFPFGTEEDRPLRYKEFGLDPTEPYQTELGVFDAPIDTRSVIVGWSAPGMYQGNDNVTYTAAWLLANQIRSGVRDDPRFVHEKGWPNVGCFAMPGKENATILCFGEVTEDAPDARAAELMLDQISEMWNPEILAIPQMRASLDNMFAMSRMYQTQGMLSSLDRVVGLSGARATDIAMYTHFSGSHSYHSDMINQLGELNPDDAINFARTWLTRDRAASVVLNPIPEEDRVLDNSESDYHGAQRSEDRVVSTIDEQLITDELIASEVQLPDFGKMIEETLPNGMRVVIYPHGEAPLMSARIIASGGERSDLLRMDHFASTFSEDPANEINPSGRPTLDPLRIAATWDDAEYNEFTTLGIHAPSGNTEQALWFLRERLDGIKPDMTSKKPTLKDWQKGLAKSWKKASYWQDRAVYEQLGLDNAAFHMREWEDYDQLMELGASDVKEYLDRKYSPANLTLLVVGNFDPQQALSDARRYLGGYQRDGSGGPIMHPVMAPIVEHEPKILLFNEKKKTQTQVEATCRIATADDNSDALRGVVAQMLSDHLFDELRAKEGITYGAYAYNETAAGGTGLFHQAGLIQNDGVALAANAFIKVAEDAAAGDFPLNRLGATRLSQARKYGLGQQATASMASWLQSTIGMGRDWSHRTGFAERLSSVDVEQMTELMAPCPNTLIIKMVGPVETIKPVLDEAGLEYEVFDHEAQALELLDAHYPKGARKFRKSIKKREEAEAEAAAEEAAEGSTDE